MSSLDGVAAGERVHLACIGFQRDHIDAALSTTFVLHHVGAPERILQELGPDALRVRGILTTPMSGVSAQLIDDLPALEIAVLHGVGLERVDHDTAHRRGVVVATTPVLFDDVADLAVILAMSVARRVVEADAWVRGGNWPSNRFPAGRRFSGRRAGILGMGRIGQMVASRLSGFDMEIGFFDPFPPPTSPYRAYASVVELAEASDYLFLCAGGNPGGGKIVDTHVLRALGPDGIFVNVSRGWLVDEAALVHAVANQWIGGAGLDVFDDEPNVPPALSGAANVVLLPHIASNTVDTRIAMERCMIDNIQAWFNRGAVLTPAQGYVGTTQQAAPDETAARA